LNFELREKAIVGLKWSYFATVVNAILQVGYTAVMARLLEPKAFGLVALAGVILRFGVYFSQMGINQAIIQKEHLSDADIRCAFTVSFFLGLIFLALVWLLSPFIRIFYDQLILVSILRVLAISLLISNIGANAVSLLRRDLRFKNLALIQIVSQVLGFAAVGIPTALMGFGVWSLVFAALTQSVVNGCGAYLMTRHSIRFLIDWKTYKPLFSFGSRISIISFFEFLGGSMDTLLIGRYLGTDTLGIYNRAYTLASLPAQQFSTSLSHVLFPSFSKIQNDIPQLRELFLKSISLISFFLFPFCIAISIAAEQVVLILLGASWKPAIPVLQILALVVPFSLISHYAGILCDSTGKLNRKLAIQGIYVIAIGSLIITIYRQGIVFVALAVLVLSFLRTIALLLISKGIIDFTLKQIFLSFKVSLLYSFAVVIGLGLVKYFFVSQHFTIYVTAAMLVILYLLMTAIFINQHKYIKELIRSNVSFFKIKKSDH